GIDRRTTPRRQPPIGVCAVSGLVLAVFVASCAIGIITTIVAYNDGAVGDTANAGGTVLRGFIHTPETVASPSQVSSDAMDDLSAIDGVEGVAAIHSTSSLGPTFSKDGRPHATPHYVAC